MKEVTISARNQIVIPREARKALGISAGDKVVLEVRGAILILLPKPFSAQRSIRGMAGGTYQRN